MIYMMVFWAIFLISLVIYLFIRKRFENIAMPIILLAFSFLIIGIVTKDPLFSPFGVPVEFEWVVGLFFVGLSAWRFYFNPLKERVIDSEKDISSLKTDVSNIKTDIAFVKNDISVVKTEVGFIKDYLINKKRR